MNTTQTLIQNSRSAIAQRVIHEEHKHHMSKVLLEYRISQHRDKGFDRRVRK